MATPYDDLDLAAAQALTWTRNTAQAKGWTAGWSAVGEALISQAKSDADRWNASSATQAADFWRYLNDSWDKVTSEANYQRVELPTNWTKLGGVWDNAIAATGSAAAQEDASSALTIVGGTVSGAAQDLADVGQAAGEAGGAIVDLFKSPWAWAALAAVGLWAASQRR